MSELLNDPTPRSILRSIHFRLIVPFRELAGQTEAYILIQWNKSEPEEVNRLTRTFGNSQEG